MVVGRCFKNKSNLHTQMVVLYIDESMDENARKFNAKHMFACLHSVCRSKGRGKVMLMIYELNSRDDLHVWTEASD